MLERRRARHQALHILYQREITEDPVARILAEASYSDEDGDPSEFCRELLIGVEQHQMSIDATISAISENWTISRMPLVDRNILRIAVYELLYREDVPASVSINEAVEMAKVYGGEDSSRFVNGILGRLADEREALKNAEGEARRDHP